MISNKEYAKNLIDQIPDDMLPYIIHFLMGASIPSEPSDAVNSHLIIGKTTTQEGV